VASTGRVRLFEPSTEIIRKGKAAKPNEFGKMVKMVKLQEAENQIVIDFEVYDRRPNDGDLPIPAIEAHQARLGRLPYLVAADAAFYSAKNEVDANAKGVKRVRVPNRSTKSSDRKQTRAEEALVPQRAEVAHRIGGPYQRRQAAPRARSLPLQGRQRHAALGRARRDRRRRQPPIFAAPARQARPGGLCLCRHHTPSSRKLEFCAGK